jgi:hypothetical protein
VRILGPIFIPFAGVNTFVVAAQTGGHDMKLYPFFDMDGAIGADSGVEQVSAAETQQDESYSSETGVESQVAAEPEKNGGFEKAFAKRLSSEREKWQREVEERYKDYDIAKKATEYLMRTSGIDDPMTLKEQLELADLQERADRENVPTEVIRRIDQLEAKAAKAEEYERIQEQQKFYSNFRSQLDAFIKDKGVDAEALEQFMIDNRVSDMNIAYRAMKFDEVSKDREKIEKEAVTRYLDSKKAPKAEGSGTPGYTAPSTPKTFEEARRNALEMMRSANQKQ